MSGAERSEPDDAAVDDDPTPEPGGPAEAGAPSEGTSPLEQAAAAVELDLETLIADFEKVAAERDQYLDAARRTQADFENFRKQSQRRQEDHVERALGAFVERLLPVLDACDAAQAHGVAEVEPIVAALLGALEKEGLTRIDPIGEPFDPTVAEAVVHEPGTGGEHTVAEVMRKGYAWQGRVLRPAMVKVTD